MKEFIERLKERYALHRLNSLDAATRQWFKPGWVYAHRWQRLKHTDRKRVVYMAIELLEAGRSLTEAEQDSLWRLVVQIYIDHDLQLACGMDRLRAFGWKPEYDKFNKETDSLRDRLDELIGYSCWFEDFLDSRVPRSPWPSVP